MISLIDGTRGGPDAVGSDSMLTEGKIEPVAVAPGGRFGNRFDSVETFGMFPHVNLADGLCTIGANPSHLTRKPEKHGQSATL